LKKLEGTLITACLNEHIIYGPHVQIMLVQDCNLLNKAVLGSEPQAALILTRYGTQLTTCI